MRRQCRSENNRSVLSLLIVIDSCKQLIDRSYRSLLMEKVHNDILPLLFHLAIRLNRAFVRLREEEKKDRNILWEIDIHSTSSQQLDKQRGSKTRMSHWQAVFAINTCNSSIKICNSALIRCRSLIPFNAFRTILVDTQRFANNMTIIFGCAVTRPFTKCATDVSWWYVRWRPVG